MNSKTTKRALLGSVVAMLVCFTMLLSTTFAWFTDTAVSGSNVITSGKLDIALVDAEGNSLEGEIIEWAAKDGRAQADILWEPGCTYETEEFYIENKGNLKLKFKFAVTGIDGDAKLLEVIDFSAVVEDYELTYAIGGFTVTAPMDVDLLTGKAYDSTGAAYDVSEYILAPGEKMGPIVLTGKMDTAAGNEYQDLTIEGIAVTVAATQAIGEEDSFDGVYDKDATYPVTNAEELKNALDNAQDGDTILLAEGDFELPATIDKAINIVGSENGTKVAVAMPSNGDLDDGTAAIKINSDNVTLKNLVFDSTNSAQGAMVYSQAENLTVENCTFDMRGTNNAGVTLWNSDSATIRNCTFINGMKSIYVNGKDVDTETDTDTLLIENCSFEGVYALHIGGAANTVVNNCDFNGTAITLWNGTAKFTDCDFNNGSYNQLLNYYTPITFEKCFFGSEFVYALRQAKNEVNVVVNNATYETVGNTFATQCGWAIVTSGSITSFNVVENGNTTVIPTTQKV